MKKSLFILFAIITAINLNTQAEDFSAIYNGDTIYYNITSSVSPRTVEVTYRGSSSSYYSNEYSGCVSIPDSVLYNSNYYKVISIEIGAFWDCTGLTSVMISKSVNSIGSYAFSNCSNLTSIIVNENNLHYSSYDGILYSKNSDTIFACPGGKAGAFIIPSSVTSIGEGAFIYCIGLTSITIPSSVTSIGPYAFQRCTDLTSITIPNSINYIDTATFAGCSSLMSIIIPSSVTSIGISAFYYCTSLTSITIPNSVNLIDDWAFYYCTGLTSITIPSSVTSIGVGAFYGSTGLTSIIIPNSVISIGDYAFQDCTGLTSITSQAINPPIIALSTFSNINKSIPLYVPCSSLSFYQSDTLWNQFTNIVCESGLENITQNTISTNLYPNPSEGKAKLEIIGLSSDAYVMIYDMLGRVIQRHNINQGQKLLDIDLSGYAKGVYNIRIVNTNMNQTKKLIVQ